MIKSSDTHSRCRDSRQRGGSRLNFLIFAAIVVTLLYVGYQFVPVAYRASTLQVYMQDTVNAAAAANKSTDWVRQQVILNRDDYSIPEDAIINAASRDRRMELRVQFTRPIPLPGYVYDYNFDHTAKSRSFLVR